VIIPKYLYRGDNDSNKQRNLKSLINCEMLLTNLCNGGNGREIFNNSLGQSVNKHIGVGWDKTHFLSFSTNEETAFYYGSNNKQHYEVFEFSEDWDFAVLTLDTTLLIEDSIKEIDIGIYSAQFLPACKEFLPRYNLILIDAFSYLINTGGTNPVFAHAIKNADKDKEWLILPANIWGHTGEFTAKLDTNCISDKRVFKLS
jgi:hypothetical protein